MVTHLLPHEDATLIILKGHLLVEEQLFAAVSESVAFPGAIRGWHPRFTDLLAVAKGLFYKSAEDWLWNSIEYLNTLRNELAHTLEPKQMESSIEKLIGPTEKVMKKLGLCAEGTLTTRLRSVFPFMLGVLGRFRKEPRTASSSD
jgi:hypothetical protein